MQKKCIFNKNKVTMWITVRKINLKVDKYTFYQYLPIIYRYKNKLYKFNLFFWNKKIKFDIS